MSSRYLKHENFEGRVPASYFKKKSHSVEETVENIAVPVNQSHDNIFTKKLDILIEQEFENELDFEQERIPSVTAGAAAVFDYQDY